MRHRLCVGIIALAMILPAALAPGQAVSLQEQLVAQYQVAKVRQIPAGTAWLTPARC
jgi:hypothetical protein